MKRVAGYVVAFTAGTLLSGTAAFAATNYVQALSGTSTVSVNGNAVAHPPKLVYGGTTYVQLYSIQQGLKQLGINPTWNGSTFNMLFSNTGAMSRSQFTSTVQQELKQEANIFTEIQNISENTLSQTNTTTINSVLSELNDAQARVVSWNVSEPDEQKIKVLINDITSTIEDSTLLMKEAVTAESNGDMVTATEKASAAVDVLSLYQDMFTQLKTYLAEYGLTFSPTGDSTSGNTTGGQQTGSTGTGTTSDSLPTSITVDGNVIHLTYMTGLNLSTGSMYDLIAQIDPSDYGTYLQLLINGHKSDIVQALQPLASDMAQVAKSKGYASYFLDVQYQGTYSTYPSGYDPSEIDVTSTGDFLVTHTIFTISDGNISVK